MKRSAYALALVAIVHGDRSRCQFRRTRRRHGSSRKPGSRAFRSAPTEPLGKSMPDHPGFYAGEASSQSVGACRTRDLVQGHRRQRPLSHLRLPAARRRADRLVSRAQCERARRPLRAPGESSTTRAAAFRDRRTARRRRPEETYGFDWCPGDDVLLKFVGQAGLSRSGVRLQGRAARSR